MHLYGGEGEIIFHLTPIQDVQVKPMFEGDDVRSIGVCSSVGMGGRGDFTSFHTNSRLLSNAHVLGRRCKGRQVDR